MIIYLNGASSSGKTAIAVELQKLEQEPFFYYSIDTLLYSLADEDVYALMGQRPFQRELNWDAIYEGYFASVAALAYMGNNVIADCPIYSEKLKRYFSKHLGAVRKKIVKIDCPLSILEERESTRSDRRSGVARDQFDGIHRYLNFDIEVSSATATPSEIAAAIYLDKRYAVQTGFVPPKKDSNLTF